MTLIIWSLTCALWSTVWVFIKLGVADVPPVTFAAYRLFVALLVLAPITVARRLALPRNPRDWVLIGGTGVLLLGVALAEPPIAMMLGAAILDETLSARMIAGTICILVSVAVVLDVVPAAVTSLPWRARRT